jgi:hypothetical protein
MRREEPVGPTDFLVPTGVSRWAIASCYFGLIGLCVPCLGLVLAIPAFVCGVVAIRQRRNDASYGSVTSNVRAIIGLVASGLAIILYGLAPLVLYIVAIVTK